MNNKSFKLDWLILPLFGAVLVVVFWQVCSMTWAKELPSPARTWENSKSYILDPFAKRGEMDQCFRSESQERKPSTSST